MEGVRDEPDAALRGVPPDHGLFKDAIAFFLSEVEDLGIETETVELLKAVKVPGDISTETLESALRVVDPMKRKKSREEIESAPHSLANDILMDLDPGIRKRARTDHDIETFFEMP